MTVKYIQLRTGIRWTTFVLSALSTTPASPRWRLLRRTSCTWAGRWRRDCDLLVKIYCFSVVGSLILVIIFCSWLRKLGLKEEKVQRLHSHVGDSIHQVQSKICAVQWEPHKIRESGRKDFVFRSFFPLGDTEDVFETVKVGRLRVEKVLWPWHEDVWVQALPISLKLYLFHVRHFIFCDICDILYSCDICDILYSWPLAIRNVSL